MINDGANPLAEVALALAMAFFSLMILMLFAMVNTPQSDLSRAAPDTIDLTASSKRDDVDDRERQIVIFTENGLFDQALVRLDPSAIDPDRPVVLAVSDSMPISRITAFQREFPGLSIEIAELGPDWQAQLTGPNSEAAQ